jgi:hypothetical protein
VNLTYGTALDNSQLSGSATWTVGGKSVMVPGTYTYTSARGTVLGAGSGQSEAVTFTPCDSTDYTTVSTTVSVNVAQATPTVQVIDTGCTYTQKPFAAITTVTGVSAIAGSSLEAVTPTLTYYAGSTASGTPLSGAPVLPGTYTAKAPFAGSTDYTAASATTTFSITKPTSSSVARPITILAATPARPTINNWSLCTPSWPSGAARTPMPRASAPWPAI